MMSRALPTSPAQAQAPPYASGGGYDDGGWQTPRARKDSQAKGRSPRLRKQLPTFDMIPLETATNFGGNLDKCTDHLSGRASEGGTWDSAKRQRPSIVASPPPRSDSLSTATFGIMLHAFPTPPATPSTFSVGVGSSNVSPVSTKTSFHEEHHIFPDSTSSHEGQIADASISTSQTRPSFDRSATESAAHLAINPSTFRPRLVKHASTSALLDVRPVSIHFNPEKPPTIPLPPLPVTSNVLQNSSTFKSPLSILPRARPPPPICPPLLIKPPPLELPLAGPPPSPSFQHSSSQEDLRLLSRTTRAHFVPQSTSTFPLHITTESEGSLRAHGPVTCRAQHEPSSTSEPEVDFDALVQSPLPKKRYSSSRRSSSFGSSSSSRSHPQLFSRSRSQSASSRRHRREISIVSNGSILEAQISNHGDLAQSFERYDHFSDSETSETSEDSDIDVEASLDASAWRAGIMSKALMEIDSEDEETQAQSVKELTSTLAKARLSMQGRATSPEQRRLAYTPYKIARPSFPPPQQIEEDDEALSEEEENFDLLFDHESTTTSTMTDVSLSPISSYSRRSTASSFTPALYGPASYQGIKSRLSRDGFGEKTGLGLDNGCFDSATSHETSPERPSHSTIRPRPSLPSFNTISERSAVLDANSVARLRAGSLATSTGISGIGGLRRPTNYQVHSPTSQTWSTASSRSGGDSSTEPRSPILRSPASTSSLKTLTTVARMQSGIPESIRYSTLPRLRRDANIISTLCAYDFPSGSDASATPTSVAFQARRSISPTTQTYVDGPTSSENTGPRAPTLRPLRTSRSSTILNRSSSNSTESALPRLTSISSRSAIPSTSNANLAPSGHGRRLSRSIPYVVSSNTAPGKLILPHLVNGDRF